MPFALSGNEIPPRWRRSQGSLVCVPKGDGTRQPLGDVSAIVRSWFPMVIKTGMIKTCLAPRYTPASALCALSPIQPRVDSMQLPWRTPRRARDTVTVNRGLVDLTTGLTTLSAWSRFLARKGESPLRERKGACSPLLMCVRICSMRRAYRSSSRSGVHVTQRVDDGSLGQFFCWE